MKLLQNLNRYLRVWKNKNCRQEKLKIFVRIVMKMRNLKRNKFKTQEKKKTEKKFNKK